MLHQYAALNPPDVRGLAFEIGPAQFRFITEIAALFKQNQQYECYLNIFGIILSAFHRRLCLHCSSPFPRRRWDAFHNYTTAWEIAAI